MARNPDQIFTPIVHSSAATAIWDALQCKKLSIAEADSTVHRMEDHAGNKSLLIISQRSTDIHCRILEWIEGPSCYDQWFSITE